jgi:hypothetical protein
MSTFVSGWSKLRADSVGTVSLGVDDAAVGQDHFEAEHHVLDLAVARRVLPGAATGEPAANGGEIHRLWPMAQGVAGAHLPERRFEVRAECARPHVGGQ